MKIGTTTTKVQMMLTKFAHLRDDDNKLIACIWKWQIEDVIGIDYNALTAHQLLKMIAEHKLASSESIRRTRCKLQELKPALRGLKYLDRQKNAEKVKKELKDWKTEDITQLSITDKKCSCSDPYEYMSLCGECGLKIEN